MKEHNFLPVIFAWETISDTYLSVKFLLSGGTGRGRFLIVPNAEKKDKTYKRL